MEGKLPDGQEPAAVDVDYTATGDLQPLDSTTLEDQLQVKSRFTLFTPTVVLQVFQLNCDLQTAVLQLEAKDWAEAIRGLNTIRQAAAHHQDACEALL